MWLVYLAGVATAIVPSLAIVFWLLYAAKDLPHAARGKGRPFGSSPFF
jgi:hypothetical protein